MIIVIKEKIYRKTHWELQQLAYSYKSWRYINPTDYKCYWLRLKVLRVQGEDGMGFRWDTRKSHLPLSY